MHGRRRRRDACVLDRAEKRNALGPAFWSDLPRFMAALDARRRRPLRGARRPRARTSRSGSTSRSFGRSAARRRRAGERGRRRTARCSRACVRMQASVTSVAACRKPVVAAVHGYCIGGGVDLIAACDVRLASDDAVFSVRETKIAIVADLGSLQRLPRLIGAGHVAELALTGKDIDAERARTIGLVNDVYAGGAEGVRKAARRARRRDRGELAARGPGHQGRPRGERRTDGRRGPRVRRVVEQPLPAKRRPHRGDDGVLREAPAEVHRALSYDR